MCLLTSSCKFVILSIALFRLGAISVQAQASESPLTAGREQIHLTKSLIDRLANLTDDTNGVWVLMPSNVNSADRPAVSASDFNLFKLDTSPLVDSRQSNPSTDTRDQEAEDSTSDQTNERHVSREGRKMGLLRNVLNKPKVSPLYLVNGTVCRFVNSQPICTTLSTTGLFRNQNQNQIFPNNNNFQQQQQNFNQNQNQNFQNQNSRNQNQQQNNQFRPAALLDDEAPGLSVESSNISNSTVDSSMLVQGIKQPQQQAATQVGSIAGQQQSQYNPGVSYVAVRRPLNLFPFARPIRSSQQQQQQSLFGK